MAVRRSALHAARLVAIVAWFWAASPTPAAGSEEARLDLRRTREVSWVDASVDAKVETVTIRILAPLEDGRFLYQRCRLTYSGAGEYSCGVESNALDGYPGDWVAKLSLDTVVSDRLRFASR